MRSLNLAILPAVLALTGCGGQSPERGEDGREAEGEVLGGTISDQMLPLDTLKSQSPVLRQSPGAAGDSTEAEEGDETSVEEGEDAAQPAPAGDAAPAGE